MGNLTKLEGSLLINNNGALTNLDGLTDLTEIGFNLILENNNSLANVDKLSVFSNIGNGLLVGNNPSLTSCCGLYNLLCSNPPVCDTPGAPAGAFIFSNGAGCTDVDIIANGPC